MADELTWTEIVGKLRELESMEMQELVRLSQTRMRVSEGSYFPEEFQHVMQAVRDRIDRLQSQEDANAQEQRHQSILDQSKAELRHSESSSRRMFWVAIVSAAIAAGAFALQLASHAETSALQERAHALELRVERIESENTQRLKAWQSRAGPSSGDIPPSEPPVSHKSDVSPAQSIQQPPPPNDKDVPQPTK